jgi:capsular polysaccharide biosynthesis protein
MSLAAQMRLFREASVVIAPTGAALTNIIWCQPGTSVIVLAASHEAMPLEIWSQLGKVSDCTVASVAGSRAYTRTDLYSLHDDYTIEPSHVIRLIG